MHRLPHSPALTSTLSSFFLFQNYTQYIPLSIYDLQTWMGSPSIFVYDCSNAGIIVKSFKQFALQREQELEVGSRTDKRRQTGGGIYEHIWVIGSKVGDLSYAQKITHIYCIYKGDSSESWVMILCRNPLCKIQDVLSQSKGQLTVNHWICFSLGRTPSPPPQIHTTASPQSFHHFIFLLRFPSPGYGMLCESLMRWCCHSSQLFMEKFQPDCRLAGKWVRERKRKVQDEQYRAERREAERERRRAAVNAALPVKVKVKAAAKLLSCRSVWQNSSQVSLSPQPLMLFSA